MIRLGTALTMALLLAGCDAPDPSITAIEATESAIAEVSASRPVLVAAGLDIVPVVAASGNGWIGGAVLPDMADSYNANLGLYRSTRMFKGGSVVTDRTDYGGLYMVVTRSGMGERCGSPAGLTSTANAILTAVGRDTLTTEEKTQANGIWQSGGSDAEFQRPGALIRVIGGCIKVLLIKAV